MFEFRKIQLSDRDEVNKRLAVSDFRGCEYTFANNVAWQRLNDTKICFFDNFYICCSVDGAQPYITFPVGVKTDNEGKRKYIALFEELKRYFESSGNKLVVSSVTDENLVWLKEFYGDKISDTLNRDVCDYVYNSADLINLSGKKYHGKRNHIKRFMENEWSFENINEKNLDDCILFASQFYNASSDVDHSAIVEQYAINLFFMNMDYLRLKGGVLRSRGEIVGFTIGEQLNSDTFVIHIEKARADIQGAYPTLTNQFAKANAYNLPYINREEDLGLEGLRKSKLSYKPVFMVNKHTVYFK